MSLIYLLTQISYIVKTYTTTAREPSINAQYRTLLLISLRQHTTNGASDWIQNPVQINNSDGVAHPSLWSFMSFILKNKQLYVYPQCMFTHNVCLHMMFVHIKVNFHKIFHRSFAIFHPRSQFLRRTCSTDSYFNSNFAESSSHCDIARCCENRIARIESVRFGTSKCGMYVRYSEFTKGCGGEVRWFLRYLVAFISWLIFTRL